MKYDSAHAECSVPWLNEVLVLFTVGLQLCQQLKDKVCTYEQNILPSLCFEPLVEFISFYMIGILEIFLFRRKHRYFDIFFFGFSPHI